MQILINFDDLIIFEKVCKYWSILSAIDAFEIQQYETSLLAIIFKNESTIMLSGSSQGESSVLRVRLRVIKKPLQIHTSPLRVIKKPITNMH